VDLPEKSRPSTVTKRPRLTCPARGSLRCGPAARSVSLGGGDVSHEEVAVLGTLCVTHSLRVPLHSYEPALGEVVDSTASTTPSEARALTTRPSATFLTP
jgi:hypothetical protein